MDWSAKISRAASHRLRGLSCSFRQVALSAMRVAFFNNKGGVGKTTLSVNTACYASFAGLRVLFVGTDRQGDGFRFFARGKKRAEKSAVLKLTKNLSAIYHPMSVPKINSSVDLTIIDCPPSVQVASEYMVDVWIIILTSRFSFENSFNVFPALFKSGAKIIFLLNRKGEGGLRITRKLEAAINEVPNLSYYSRGIEQHNAFKRMESALLPVWCDQWGEKPGEDIREFSHYLLNTVCGFKVPKATLVQDIPWARRSS